MTAEIDTLKPDWGPLEIVSCSPEQTQQLGFVLGHALATGLVVRLRGDPGSGKTCFVQGLARGLDVPSAYRITSPTYTLINEYPGRLPLVHVDLYRISGPVDGLDLGLEEVIDGRGVLAIEWGERLTPRWLTACLDLEFSMRADEQRLIRVTAYGLAPDNLIKDLFASVRL